MFYVRNGSGMRNMSLNGLYGTFYRASVKTSLAHGNTDGDLVEIRDIQVDCILGSKTYPSVSNNTEFTVSATGLTGTAFEVNIGTSTIPQSYVSGGTVLKANGTRLAITGFVYNTGTGIATITTATHNLSANDTVNLFGIITNCTYGTKVYPQMPHAGVYPVSVVDTDDLNFFLPTSNITHTYDTGGTVKDVTVSNVGSATNITAFNYGHETGYTTVTSANHGLAVGDYVKLQSIKVSCAMGEKVYPDSKTSSGLFYVYDVIDANTFAFGMDKSTFVHTYVSGGTVQKVTWTATNSRTVANFTYTSSGITNEHGTKRPTGGAFVSLDPGTGPADTSVHITNKSPYIQNVSNFGTKCIGLKVDGNLHNAGYKSIVANDFTQILNDGIGYYGRYNGVAELVSVFTYYCHVGYLCENGGRLRATNGNNSYGDFGSVSEGVNPTETAKTGTVTNRSTHAQIQVVENNGANLLAFGYSNAGTNYTGTPAITLSGSGYGVSVAYEEIRKHAISEIRMTDPGDSSNPGGLNYTYIVNSAQWGDDTSIQFSQSDTSGTSEAYVGQRLIILSGPGDGQYGRISSYNSGTKIATVERESDGAAGWEHIYPGYPVVSTLTTATKYAIEPRVVIPEPAFTSSSLTVPHLIDVLTATGNNFIAMKTDLISYSVNAGATWNTATGSTTGNWREGKAYPGTSYVMAFDIDANAILSANNGQSWSSTTMPATPDPWIDIAYKSDKWIAITSGSSTETAISTDNGSSWSVGTTISGQNKKIAYGNGIFVIMPVSGNTALTSTDGTTWTTRTLPVTSNWNDLKYANGRFVAAGVSDAKIIYSFDGISWYDAYIDISNVSDSSTGTWKTLAYSSGVWMCCNETDNTIITSQSGSVWTSLLDDSTTKAFATSGAYSKLAGGEDGNGLPIWIGSKGTTDACSVTYGAKALVRARITGSRVGGFTIYDPGSGYSSTPTITIYDYPNTSDATYTVRKSNSGVLGQPVFNNRGLDWNISSATISGNGYADSYQTGKQIKLENVTAVPTPGENFIISGISDIVYKVVSIDETTGAGPYNLTLSINPTIGVAESPEHGTAVELRENYSQIRLTGHDFLDIGTGDFTDTNYPTLYTEGYNFGAGEEPKQFNEVVEAGGGRVFYTSTDQDGNFRAGEQFLVEQATGIITLNSSLFNFTGLQSLTLGGVVLGGTAVVITEFSKEQTFIGNSNSIIPTQRAIAAYITSRVSGGGAQASTNQLNVGQIKISTNEITTGGGTTIQVPQKMTIKGGADGHYLASMYFPT